MAYNTLYLVDHGFSVIEVDLEKVLEKLLDLPPPPPPVAVVWPAASGRDYSIIVLTFEIFHSSGEEYLCFKEQRLRYFSL